MRNKIYGIFLICFFGICMSVNAQGTPEVYNRNEEVILSNDLYYSNGEYYFHIDDLERLGLSVTKEDAKYTITSNDCLGVERKLQFEYRDNWNVIYPTPDLFPISEESASIKRLYCSGSYSKRSIENIGGTSSNIIISPDNIVIYPETGTSFINERDIMIMVGDEYYISSEYVGKMSHKYLWQDNRLDLFIANTDSVIIYTTVNLRNGAVAPTGGYNVDIYTAYKTGEGESLSDFEILTSTTCTVLENEKSANCVVEIPSEKVISNNIYFIADFGDRYELSCKEFDFSKVDTVLVYGKQKDITYTVNVTLPEIDEVDVPFTVYVEADRNTYSKEGVIEAGEISTVLEMTGLPVTGRYSTRIEFDYHKYKNAYLEDINFIDSTFANDFESDFTAELSKEVICTISLPDEYVAEGDIEVELTLSKYFISGVSIVDDLTDWSDTKTIILNNENRSEEVCLYNQTSESMLSYRLKKDVEGLCRQGYLYKKTASSDRKYAQKIKENLVAQMSILQKKNMKVTVIRPYRLSTDKDIFAKVMLMSRGETTSIIDYTKMPLIASGERKAEFEFEIIEDETYTLQIADITGDDRLFDYCWYVRSFSSVAEEGKKKQISFKDDSISLTLLECNNISGTVLCEDDSLDFEVFAFCELYNGYTVNFFTKVENGKFNLKIPKDTDTYILGVQTPLLKKSYYVSDGVSTTDENLATEIVYELEDNKNVIIEYIVQNASPLIDISTQPRYEFFIMENISDCLIDSFDAYIAYYDKNESLISVEKTEITGLESTDYRKIPINASNYKIKKVKAFAWEKNGLTPLGNVTEKVVNEPHAPDEDLSVFAVEDINAVINCENVVLSRAPIEINGDLYISAEDFEIIGYTVTVDGSVVSIEDDELKFKFKIGDYTAIQTIDNWNYELSAPILDNGGIIIPVVQVSELFEEKVDWYNETKMTILNMPFSDIEYSDTYREAILRMYYDGVFGGYEDGTFKSSVNMMRSEAARCFMIAMGYLSNEYEFKCLDVPLDHWAKSYVGICINEGVFELEDNKFRPDDYITVEESIVATLKMMGVYSKNYIEVAREVEVLKNIDINNIDRAITRAEMAQLLYNASK